VVQIPPTTNPSKNPSTSTLNQSSPIPKKFVLIRVHSWFKSPHHQPLEKPRHNHTQRTKFQPQKNSCPFVVQIPPAFLPLSTPPPLIFETRFRRLSPRRLQSRRFVCTALWCR
jgi:hypothetical protein